MSQAALNELVKLDSFLVNEVINLGTGDQAADRLSYSQVGFDPLPPEDKEVLYASSQFCQKVCRSVPEKAVSKGWEIGLKEQNPKLITEIKNYEDYIAGIGDDQSLIDSESDLMRGMHSILCQAQIWANIMDGSAVIMNIDDGEPPSKPVQLRKIRTIVGMELVDRYQIQPVMNRDNNPLRPEYYQLINIHQFMGDRMSGMFDDGNSRNYYIHPSRVLRFDGIILTRQMMLANGGWGGSPLDLLWNSFIRYETIQQSIANLCLSANILIHKIKNYRSMAVSNTKETRSALSAMLQIVYSHLHNHGVVPIDAEKESFETLTRNFAGVPDLLDKFKQTLIAETNLPHTLVFGEAPGSGLGPKGESEEKAIADVVEQYQETILRPKLNRLYKLIFWAKDGPTKGKGPPKDWSVNFLPLLQESQKDVITNRQTQATIDNTYVSLGVLTKQEVRQSRFSGSEYSFETMLDEASWKAEQEAANAQQSGGYGDLGNFDFGGQNDTGDDSTANNDSANLDSRYLDQDRYQQVYQEARSRFLIWPSRYAEAWINKRYRQLAGEEKL
jgi:phage-related protein (TIGR01555 family)